ncbi:MULTISPECIES: aminoglycoside phosphotransferase family protein [unclassified Streptomyces]|uniref:aminoglycoside phosphotransferase family protein n=1 Tax=unclassified Streptomyces TaxID=2593676 RepID=UPI001BE76C9C|nr:MULTISPECIES: aminoglycoside phosphotransferase family protein [unclassified Streptomyces]MBT2408381.1 hydroxyurea phosphotransferase [Streptomyces sp. ISL-21]MBT2611680.1 hydroxyurea phosphotransferase [Streptomyces sp. ISL-87]
MVEIPAGLVEAQVRFNGAAGREFIAGLPARAAEFLERWGLRGTGPGMHGVTALVLPVERADGTAAVLKMALLDEESAGEPLALRAWGGEGCVRLLEHDGPTGTMLLERLDEGRHLSALAERDSRQAVGVIAELLARLTAVEAPAGVRGLGGVVAGMLADVPGALRRLADGRERGLLADCAAAVGEVAGEPGGRLLHWDLHYDNVLGAGREPWLAIDPKPLAGDPGFDLLPAIQNNFRVDEVVWRFDLLTAVLGLDRGRARAWTLGRVLQNCLWDVEDGEVRLQGEQLAVAELLLGR